MAVTDELSSMTAGELAARIRRRDISPVEALDACAAVVEARNPQLNALVYTNWDAARERAHEAQRELSGSAPLGPLHGVPTALKDLFDFKPGWPATFGGIPALREFSVPARCGFCERIEDRGGAVVVGKTNSPVMGFRGTTDNRLFGATSNPFDLARNPGGSSGGGAAAVAAGLLPFAEGTDGGGSIRIPASWCGVYGFKASFGRVPTLMRPNAFGSTHPFIFEGPLTRTVEDAALVLSALCGPHPADPYSAFEDGFDPVAALKRDIRGMRIAYSPNLDVHPVDPRVAEVVAAAVRRFEEAGAHVEEVRLGIEHDQRELSDLWCRMIMPLNHSTLEGLQAAGIDLLADHPDDLPPQYRDWLERTADRTAADVARDDVLRTELFDAVQGVFATHDLLVSPTLSCLPVENAPEAGDTTGPSAVEGVAVDELIGWCLTYHFNYTGHPACSIPAGMAEGLPVGMQIVGRRGADADVLAASAVFERLAPWRGTYAQAERNAAG